MKYFFNSLALPATLPRRPTHVFGWAALLASVPLLGHSQGVSPAPAPIVMAVANTSNSNSQPLLRGLILAQRDITKATSAIAADAADLCVNRGAGGASPAPGLALLASDDAAAQYRRSLLAAGPVAREGEADPLLSAAVAPFIGRPINEALMREISQAVIAHLNAEAQLLSDVYFPPQDVKDGIVVLVVAPSRLGKVVATGQQHSRAEDLICHIRIAPGQPVDPKVVADDVAFLNRNPWRRTDAAFAPGAAPGQTDILLTTTDERPLRFFVGVDNAGSSITGLGRYRMGVSVGSPFGLFDHRFDYTYLQALDQKKLNGHLLNYSMPLNNRDTLQASANYFRSNVDLIDGLFNSRGSNTGLGLEWKRTLGAGSPFSGPSSSSTFSEIFAGVEYKRIGSALAFNQVQLSDTAPEVLQGYVGYNTGWNDQLGRNELGTRLTLSPGSLSGQNKDLVYDAVRPGAKSSYARLNFNYDRYTGLPDSWKMQGWQVHGRLLGQVASGALISSERFGVSGSQGVRGYYDDTLYGDSGLVLNLELQTPYYPVNLGGKQALVQGLAFIDAGQAYNKTAEVVADLSPAASNTHSLVSHGLGLRFNLNPTLTLQGSIGWRDTGLQDKRSPLGQFSASLAF